MKEIILTRGRVALVDDEDYPKLSLHKWHFQTRGYAARSFGPRGHQKFILMHRLIISAPERMQVDHKDGSPLNNQKANLRLCTNQQNCHNISNCRENKTSQYKGVHWNRKNQKWIAQIKAFGEARYIGSYSNESDAAHAYDDAAIEAFREFVKPNFPRERKSA